MTIHTGVARCPLVGFLVWHYDLHDLLDLGQWKYHVSEECLWHYVQPFYRTLKGEENNYITCTCIKYLYIQIYTVYIVINIGEINE